jgi:rhamnose transport system ATP-binding protein
MDAAAEAALQELGSGVRARTRLATLLPAARKQVQLVRALLADPDLLLLDEPSAVLAAGEAETLFEALRRRRHSGRSTIYVTHRLDEVHALADRVTVLRDGRRVSTDPVAAVDSSELVRRMVGREVEVPRRLARRLGDVVLEVEGLAAGVSRAVSLRLRRGEIVGLAGLVGAGRSDVLEAIAGVRAVEAGRIALLAAPTLVAEDRATKGLIPTFGVRENIFLPASEAWLRQQVERDEARRWIGELAIRCGGPEAPVASLSGGNQQKVVLARALRRRPQLLLLDEPTAGVDVGAKAEIHDLIRRLAAEGAAILLASSDLPELLLLCDRIFALRGGRVAGEVSAAEASEARLGAMITGAEI